MIAGTNRGKVIQMPACGDFMRHQWAAFGNHCVRCHKERNPERCRCGAMSLELAQKRGHRCPSLDLPPAA